MEEITKEKKAIFEKKNIQLFNGEISSNKIPVLLRETDAPYHEQKEKNVERKDENE